ncbi:MAG: hypothetical protein GY719_19675 [bacterium]|nr:hypothetical protein [bacterium]
MYEDPIVEELRAIRREHVKKFNCDHQAVFDDLKKQEVKSERAFIQRDIKRVSEPGDVEAA